MKLLLTLALRNLVSHKSKTLIVGTIMAAGTILVVLGLALLDGIETAMRRSITGSVAGDFQLYDSRAKDPLVMLGSSFISVPDVGRIDHFETVREVVSGVEGVEAVVPMGFDIGTVVSPGNLDRALEALRTEVRRSDGVQSSTLALDGPLVVAVRGLVEELEAELESQKRIAAQPERVDKQLESLRPVLEESFWQSLRTDPLAALETLDTRVAPLAEGAQQLIFRYLGTDLDLFSQNFQGFALVKGSMVPTGKRGFLFSDKFFERRIKHRVAREFDNILENLDDGLTIEEDPGQKSRVRRMVRQWRRITRLLSDRDTINLSKRLKDYLDEDSDDLSLLLQAFLDVDDDNVRERHRVFYKEIAPKIRLYEFAPGDTLTVRSYGRSGFLRSVNVTFYGTFSFRGLESSDLAGIYNLTDLATFRQLFGVMSPSERAELEALRRKVGLESVSSEQAEDALFGGTAELIEEVRLDTQKVDSIDAFQFSGADERGLPETLDPAELRSGLVLNSAVIASDKRDLRRLRKELSKALESSNLEIQVTDWQSVSGLVGQFVVVIRLILYVALTVIFLVAVVIMNNSMVMATMERVTEIGTLRAIGAHRSLVLAMFLMETLVLGVVCGVVGAAVGGGIILFLGQVGLEAPVSELRFLFGGPKLYPELSSHHILSGLFIMLLVSLVSTAYPAVLGASIQPVEAMRTEE